MQILRESIALRTLTGDWRKFGDRIALVPTMGALHDGHLALVATARTLADHVIATIFVNPLQFDDKADLDRYPRQEADDLARLQAAGCDAVWLPSADDLYPEGYATNISVVGVSERWEGAHRPGHFDGVATIVAKLFIATTPDVAIFGEKDWQQLAVIRRMTRDLGFPVEISGHETVRDADGLAMSSRNALLAGGDRAKAPMLKRSLDTAARAIADGKHMEAALSDAVKAIKKAGFGPIDYLAYVDGDSLEPLTAYRDGGRLLTASFLGKIRLIDNIRVV